MKCPNWEPLQCDLTDTVIQSPWGEIIVLILSDCSVLFGLLLPALYGCVSHFTIARKVKEWHAGGAIYCFLYYQVRSSQFTHSDYRAHSRITISLVCPRLLTSTVAKAPSLRPAASLCLASLIVCAHVRQATVAVNVQVRSHADTLLVTLLLQLSDSKVGRELPDMMAIMLNVTFKTVLSLCKAIFSSACINVFYCKAHLA